MKKIFFCINIIIISCNTFFYAYAEADVCIRNKDLVRELEETTRKKCKHINSKDLLSITGLSITSKNEFKPKHFIGLDNLLSLRLYRNNSKIKPSSLNKNLFAGLSKLEELIIIDDNISKIDSYVFADLLNLKTLILRLSKEASIAANAFSNLVKLQELDLRGTNIKSIDSKMFNGLSKLKKLSIENSQLTNIKPHTFKQLENLEVLNLDSSTMLKSVEEYAFYGLKSLVTLTLNYSNRIASISPLAFVGLDNLETFEIRENKIEKIDPSTFSGLTNLKVLDLTLSSHLTSIAPNSFTHLKNLKTLSIGSSKIDTITADTFTGLYNLEELILVSNQLLNTIRPYSFKDLTKLKFLRIWESNKLSLPYSTFEGLSNLETFQLSTTFVSNQPNLFQELKNLKELTLILLDNNSYSNIRAGLGFKCELSSNLLIYNLPLEFQDPTSEYFCPTSQIGHISYVWQSKVKSLVLSSYSLLDSTWVGQMEEMIPLIQSLLPQFWSANNSILNFYFTQLPLFSGDINELQLIRQLAVDICDLEDRFCDTRQRIHAYPGSTELQETIELLKILKSENAPAKVINATTKMESLLSFLIGSSIDLKFWRKNLPSNFKYILKNLELLPVGKELRLRFYSNLAIKTRLLMEQMDESMIKSHGYFAAIFYTQLVKEVKKNIAEIKVYQNKDKVLLSLIDLGHAERILTKQQVITLKKLVLKGDSESMLVKYTSWAVERINFDLGGSAKDPDSRFFGFYNTIIRTSILNEVEKVVTK